MADGVHGVTNYVNGSHTVKGCRSCQYVGHIDRSNAVRDRAGNPDFSKCPACGRSLMPIEAFEPIEEG